MRENEKRDAVREMKMKSDEVKVQKEKRNENERGKGNVRKTKRENVTEIETAIEKAVEVGEEAEAAAEVTLIAMIGIDVAEGREAENAVGDTGKTKRLEEGIDVITSSSLECLAAQSHTLYTPTHLPIILGIDYGEQ